MRPGASKARPLGDRYFVINGWQRKNGTLAERATEYETHAEALIAADRATLDLVDLAGECVEAFEVFVGSKSELDRRLLAARAP